MSFKLNGRLPDEIVRELRNEVAKATAEVLARASRSCIGCEHFRENEGELCALANARPPARVIAEGCDSHEDEIPF